MPRPPSRHSAPAEAGLQLSLPLFDSSAPAQSPAAPRPAAPPAPTPSAQHPHRLFQHPRGNRSLALGEHRIGYELRRARRRSIGFVIGEDGLCVSAPRWVGQAEIDAALQAKQRWILRKLMDQGERLNRLAAARVDWRHGATLPYLGEPLTLVLDARVDGAQLVQAESGRELHIGLAAHAEPGQIRDSVQSWLQRQALQFYAQRCAHFATTLQVQVRQIKLSSAHTRWGSATHQGVIRLHWRLMHFAPAVIDYVVAHELAHLREMNHSAAFWEVVRSVLPDFEAARGALKHHTLPVFD